MFKSPRDADWINPGHESAPWVDLEADSVLLRTRALVEAEEVGRLVPERAPGGEPARDEHERNDDRERPAANRYPCSSLREVQ